jgi:hypothetical protein
MRRLWASVLALSLGGLALAWDDPKTEGKQDPPSRADRLKAVKKEYMDAMSELGKEFQKAETDEEKTDIRNKAQKLRPAVLEKTLAIAKEDPKDDVGFDAIVYAVGMGAGKSATDLLIKHHVENPKIADMVLGLGRGGSDDAVAFLKAVLDKNPDKTARGRAAYAMAQATIDKIEKAKTDEEAKKFETEALEWVKQVETTYADVTQFTLPPNPNSKAEPRLLGKVIARDAKAIPNIRKLMVGKVVPEVEGEDVDGAKFKLSDYRGKVVMIDFWGHW